MIRSKKSIMTLSLSETRQFLHQNPELSHQEKETSLFIEKRMLDLNPDKILSIGKFTKVYLFDSGIDGPCIVFRADIDALPIEEKNSFAYASTKEGVSHLCGHDGHSTILLGLAQRIADNKPSIGKVALLFQSAEETGLGAKEVVEHPDFKELNPDYVFGLHNIPSYALHQILIRKTVFASASKGLILKLKGRTSHAAEPEKGINPAMAIAEITRQLNLLNSAENKFSSLSLLSFIFINMGEKAFGTSAGEAELGFTLRTFEAQDMQVLVAETERIIEEVCRFEKLDYQIEYVEEFPITQSDESSFDMILKAAQSLDLSIKELDKPMKWSEDFGFYSQIAKTGFFGIGAGLSQANLHDPNYDFPDELIETGMNMFYKIYTMNLATKAKGQ